MSEEGNCRSLPRNNLRAWEGYYEMRPTPTFMIGLFFLAVLLTIGRLYQEALAKRKEV